MQAGESGLMLQAPRGLAGEPDVAASTAKPQKDGSRGGHLSFQGGRFGDKALTTDKSLMACLGGTLVKKALMMLVAKAFLTSRFLEVVVELLLATARCLPQKVHRPFPILIGALHAPNQWVPRCCVWC
jgi:hypothetical protein